MAKDKKGFILYADLKGVIEHLTTKEKGKLLEHLLDYVNDENPPKLDRMLMGSWKHIENHLKRDLKHWESVREKRSLAGKASAEKRKQKATSVESVEQKATNPTVKDTVTDKETDISYTDFLKNNHSAKFEQMRMKLRGINEKDFFEFFNNKCIIEDIPFEFNKINARFNLLKSNWNKDTKETPTVLKLKDVGL
jgi:hypothetical protein